MNILIVEDDNNKIKHLNDYLTEEPLIDNIDIKRSYQTGLKEIFKMNHDLIILDMSLPTYETNSIEIGYKFRPFGGQEILNEMKRKKINVPTIVFTQFDSFGEGESYIVLDKLKSELEVQFPNIYIDTVYYSASESLWKNELFDIIKKV